MSGHIRVAVIDDHPLFREGVAAVLHVAGDFEIVGQGAGSHEALRLARDRQPQIMLIDIEMAGDGIGTAQRIMQAHPGIKIVFLTMSETEEHVSAAMKAGACGYVLKGVTAVELARTLREIRAGGRYVDPMLAARILAKQVQAAPAPASGGFPELTSREGQIVGQVARGLTNKEVARALTLSEKTVKHYMTSIMQKLQVRNRTELVLMTSAQFNRDERRVVRNDP